MEINGINNYCGAYCFHDQLTGQSHQLGEDVSQGTKYFNLYKFKTVSGGVLSVIVLGVSMIALGGVEILGFAPTGGSNTIAVFGAASAVWAVLGGGIWDAGNCNEPTWIDEDYGSQLHNITGL